MLQNFGTHSNKGNGFINPQFATDVSRKHVVLIPNADKVMIININTSFKQLLDDILIETCSSSTL